MVCDDNPNDPTLIIYILYDMYVYVSRPLNNIIITMIWRTLFIVSISPHTVYIYIYIHTHIQTRVSRVITSHILSLYK